MPFCGDTVDEFVTVFGSMVSVIGGNPVSDAGDVSGVFVNVVGDFVTDFVNTVSFTFADTGANVVSEAGDVSGVVSFSGSMVAKDFSSIFRTAVEGTFEGVIVGAVVDDTSVSVGFSVLETLPLWAGCSSTGDSGLLLLVAVVTFMSTAVGGTVL